jgi:hypothetical protein
MEGSKTRSAGALCYENDRGVRSVESTFYESTYTLNPISLSAFERIYRVQCIWRRGDCPRFEIINYEHNKEGVTTRSIPLKAMKFSTTDEVDRLYCTTVTVCARAGQRGKPFKFQCNSEFYQFLINSKDGFLHAFNQL